MTGSACFLLKFQIHVIIYKLPAQLYCCIGIMQKGIENQIIILSPMFPGRALGTIYILARMVQSAYDLFRLCKFVIFVLYGGFNKGEKGQMIYFVQNILPLQLCSGTVRKHTQRIILFSARKSDEAVVGWTLFAFFSSVSYR